MTARRQIFILAALTLLLAVLVAYAICRWWFPFRTVVKPWQMRGAWIAAPGATAEADFRHTLTLPGEVRHAWLAIAGADSYELSVNGRTVSTSPLARPTSPFQRTLGEPGQQIITSPSLLPRNRPREYQWSGYRSWRVPAFVDLTRHLRAGRNVICVSVGSRAAAPRLCVEGEAVLRSGERVAMRSDRDWKANALPLRASGIEWTQVEYRDDDWPRAALTAPPRGGLLRAFDPGVFREPFAGAWLSVVEATRDRPVTFETTWRIDGRVEDAWLRLVTNRAYDLEINGRPVRARSGGSARPRDGAWLLEAATPAGQRAETLDPDEVDSVFEEEFSATTRAADPTLPPLALVRNREVAAFDLYSVPWLLRRGENRLTVRLLPTKDDLQWRPRFALDAKAITTNGAVQTVASDVGWEARVGAEAAPAIATGPADSAGEALPRKIYTGHAWDVAAKWRCWLAVSAIVIAVVCSAVGVVARRRLHRGEGISPIAMRAGLAALVLVLAALVESSWIEREEALLFLRANTWGWILVAAALAAWCHGWLGRVASGVERAARGASWSVVALAGVLLLCGWVRLREVPTQPLDPDEYASVQAIFSIARTGAPELDDGIFYTRSPLYHYLVGGVVALWGEHLWALRLPSVCFAIATTALLYLIGARLLHSRWTGLIAAALFAIHPFAAFSGYLVRFYQQQQFFALLTVYLFCRGFVVGQGMRDRYLMLGAFFATVLSQELSLTIGLSLLLGYILFAERKPWASEARFAVASGCVLLLVFLDLAVFQTRCLTRVDGISPSLEPSIALNLESPSNLLLLLTAFSRLHLALSVLLLASLPLVWRQRDRGALALHVLLFSGMLVTAVFVTGTGLRYHYWLIPLWIVLGVHGVRMLAAGFAVAPPALRPATAALAIGAVVLTWSPWRLFDSAGTALQTDSASALGYVRRHARPGDAIMVSAPHTQSALLEIGRIDYDLAIPLLHDFFYRKDGRLLDRNAGAEAIRNLDALVEKCAEHERMWVLVNREDLLRSPGRDVRWQLPGARTDLFLRTNLALTHRSYMWDVFLWDRAAGRFHNFRLAR
jgi:hypothetical protein